MSNPVMPSSLTRIEVEVLFAEKDFPPFVCGWCGKICGQTYEEIEDQITDEDLWTEYFRKGRGSYLYESTWMKPQVDGYGRVELPGYWLLKPIQFKPFPEEKVMNDSA